MKRLFVVLAVTVALFGAFSAFAHNNAMADQPACSSHCFLSNQVTDLKSAPLKSFELLAIITTLVFLGFSIVETLAALPTRQIRPSPNLNKLYSRYLI